jgi:hypothetical protein
MSKYSTYDPKNKFRVQRFKLFKKSVDRIISKQGKCRILDIGGTASYWETFGTDLDWAKLDISILNLTLSETTNAAITTLVGDARAVKQFPNLSFDIVHSNSVIEHVGRWDDMVAMANEVRRLAPNYFVQTPYFWFPLEPHARFPFLHWLPESWRYRILMNRTCGYWERQPNLGMAVRAIQSAVLLDKRQMQFLFPDARIFIERIYGLIKSLIAIR